MSIETAASCAITKTGNGAVGDEKLVLVTSTANGKPDRELTETVATDGNPSACRDVNFNQGPATVVNERLVSSTTMKSTATRQPEVADGKCVAIGRKTIDQKQQQLASIESRDKMAATSRSKNDCQPGTSKSSGSGASGSESEQLHRQSSVGSNDDKESHPPSQSALRHPRKSLPFLPRTSQYERHPLLQAKSTATGLSEFELLMLEKDALVRRKSVGESSRQHGAHRKCEQQSSVDGSSATTTAAAAARRRPTLVPRGAHYEPHPLFVRSESGVCELEAYLSEIAVADKSKSALQNSNAAAAAVDVPAGCSASSSSSASAAPSTFTSASTPSAASFAFGKLEPRTSQWERNSLLEFKDASGMSELERLLKEKDMEFRSREAKSAFDSDGSCPKCGSDRAARCGCTSHAADSGNGQSCTEAVGAGCSDSVPVGDSVDCKCPSAGGASAASKRVRFVAQRQKTEPEDVGMHGVVDVTGDAATADAKQSEGRNNKSKCQQSRNYRAEYAAASAGGQRKSCCIS